MIFTKTFLRDRLLPNKRHRDEENPGCRFSQNRWLPAHCAIHKDSTDQPCFERRSHGAATNQIASPGSLLRLSFQRNPVALVRLHRSGLMVGRTRCRKRTQRIEFLRVGILLPYDAKTKTSVDGQSVARRNYAALDVSHTPSGRWPDAGRPCRAGTMDRVGNCGATAKKTRE